MIFFDKAGLGNKTTTLKDGTEKEKKHDYARFSRNNVELKKSRKADIHA